VYYGYFCLAVDFLKTNKLSAVLPTLRQSSCNQAITMAFEIIKLTYLLSIYGLRLNRVNSMITL